MPTRFVAAICTLLLMCSSPSPLVAQQAHRVAPARTLSTNLLSFSIPYKLNAAEDQFLEVQLFVSEDRGRTWRMHAKQNVSQLEFPFAASQDGEYWFCLKTLDRNRNILPPGRPQPELKITVDRQAPKLDFRIETDRAGRIVCRWDTTDRQLDPNGFTIAYRADEATTSGQPAAIPETQWQQLPESPVLNPVNQRAASQLAFWPNTTASKLTVRMTVKDLAGNMTRLDRQVVVPKVSWRNSNQNTAVKNQVPRQTTVQPGEANSENDALLARATDNVTPICKDGVCRLPGQPTPESANFPFKNLLGPLAAKKTWSTDRTAALDAPQAVEASTSIDGTPPRTPAGSQEITDSSQGKDLYAQLAQSPIPDTRSKRKQPAQNEAIDWESTSRGSTTPQRQETDSTLAGPNSNRPPSVPSQLWKPFVDTAGRADSGTAETASEQRTRPTGRVQNKQYISEATARTRTPEFIDRQLRQQGQAGPTSQLGPSQESNRKYQQTSNRRSNSDSRSSYQTSKLPLPEMLADPSKAQPINSLRFQLNYGIDSIDPSGVERVDLWVTRDLGRTWKNWGTDPDATSPFPVQVPDQGVYGFRVVIQSKDGLSGKPPAPGQQPDIQVRVDTDAPRIYISSVPYGRGAEAGRLIVNWVADDPFLTLRPISLSWSTEATGPWTEIESGLRNTGRYAWKVGTQVPAKVYLRIDAIDQAGNVGAFRLSNQIDLSGLIPRAHIKSVQPIK